MTFLQSLVAKMYPDATIRRAPDADHYYVTHMITEREAMAARTAERERLNALVARLRPRPVTVTRRRLHWGRKAKP
jgi:hypothetical protein